MKKIALLFCGFAAVALCSCGKKAEEQVEETPMDSVEVVVDSIIEEVIDTPVVEEVVEVVETVAKPAKKAAPAPGSAGELKLYDTDPRDAALIMAIVADHLGKPLNELRFKSIKEVK